MNHLSDAPLKGRLLASPTNIRLGWKGLLGTNTLAYDKNTYITAVKSFKVGAYPLALPTNIRLGWRGWPGKNTPAYYENL